MNRDKHFISFSLLIFYITVTRLPINALSADSPSAASSGLQQPLGGMGGGMANLGMMSDGNTGGMNQGGNNRSLNLRTYMPSIEPCPFTENSTDIRALWGSTIKMLEFKKAQQSQNNCDGTLEAANGLQESLASYQKKATGGADTSPGAEINCTNYELLFNSEYEQSLVANSYGVSFNSMSDYGQCNFAEDKKACVDNVFQTKLQSKRIECREMEIAAGHSLKQQQRADLQGESLAGRMAAVNKLSQDLNALLKQVATCDNKDLRNSMITAALNVATILGSANVGGAEGVAVSFAGGVMQSLTSIFLSDNYIDLLNQMKSEDEYNQLSCFFMQIQKKRCKLKTSDSPPAQPPQESAICLDRDAPAVHQIQVLSQTIRSLLTSPAVTPGTKAPPPFQRIYDRLAKKENNINGLPFFDFLQAHGQKMLNDPKVQDDTELTTQLTAIKNYDAQVKKWKANPNQDNSAERAKLLAEIDPSVIVSVLEHYQESLFDADPKTRSLFAQFKAQELQQKTYQDWMLNKDALLKTRDADYTTLDRITSTTLKALSRSFPKITTKRVEEALEKAKRETPEDAWPYIRKIVNDCQLNAGVFLMDPDHPFTDINNSTEAQSFRKMCEPFTCENGIPPFRGSGKDFGVYQCKVSTASNQTLEKMKRHSKPNQPIQICGKDLKGIQLNSGKEVGFSP